MNVAQMEPHVVSPLAGHILNLLRDSDRDVCNAAKELLKTKVTPAALASMMQTVLIPMLGDPTPEGGECRIALDVMAMLTAEHLGPCVGHVIARLADPRENVAIGAACVLPKLPAAAITAHLQTVVGALQSSSWAVRQHAVAALGLVESTVLAPHALAVVARLRDSDRDVTEAATATVDSALPTDALVSYAPFFAQNLFDPRPSVQLAALDIFMRMPPAILSQQAQQIVGLLNTPNEDVHAGLRELLPKIPPQVLAHFGPQLEAATRSEHWKLRVAALQALATIEPAALAPHAKAVLSRLQDADNDVKRAAKAAAGSSSQSVRPSARLSG